MFGPGSDEVKKTRCVRHQQDFSYHCGSPDWATQALWGVLRIQMCSAIKMRDHTKTFLKVTFMEGAFFFRGMNNVY